MASANRCYFSLLNLFKSRLLSRSTKVRIYLCYLRSILTYACKTWPLVKCEANRLATFERKVLRKIFGPFFNPVTQQFERRHNEDLYKLYDHPPMVGWIRSKRIEWLGHVWKVDASLIKDATKPVNGKRLRGRPRLRWIDAVLKDVRTLCPDATLDRAYDRADWKRLVDSAMILHGSEN